MWIDPGSIRPDTSKQQVTFGYKNNDDFNLDAVKAAIEEKTDFKVGEIVEGPIEPK